MNPRIKQLRDLVVALDRADRNIERLSPEAYQAAAKTAQRLTGEEMGLLPIGDFAGPVSALQSMAENIFFGLNGCFADLDGTGRAPVALSTTRSLLKRLRAATPDSSREITTGLLSRLAAPKDAASASTSTSTSTSASTPDSGADPAAPPPRSGAGRVRRDRIKR